MKPDLHEREHHDLLACRLGRLVLVVVVDRIERRRVEVLGDELCRHRRAVHVHPGDLVGIGAGPLGDLGEVELVAVARCDADLLALQALEIGDAGALEHEQRVRRLRVDDGDGLHRHVLARPCSHDGGQVGNAEVEAAARKLGDGVARAVAARDGHVYAFSGEDAFLPAAVVHGVLAGRDPVGLEADFVLRQGRCGDTERQGGKSDH